MGKLAFLVRFRRRPAVVTPEDRETIVADGLMTVPEAAGFLRLSRSTLYNLMDSGRLAYVRLGGDGHRAARRIPRKAVIALAAAYLVGGDRNTNSPLP